MQNDDQNTEGVAPESQRDSQQRLARRPERTKDDGRKKWMVVVVMGDDWGDMMRTLRADATNIHIDAERSGAPAPWSVSGTLCYWSGEGGRPSLDEIALLVEKAKSPSHLLGEP